MGSFRPHPFTVSQIFSDAEVPPVRYPARMRLNASRSIALGPVCWLLLLLSLVSVPSAHLNAEEQKPTGSTPVDRARAACALPDPAAAAALSALLEKSEPAAQAAIYDTIPVNRPGIANIVAAGLRSQVPGIAAATMANVARNWPTVSDHLTQIRNQLGSGEPEIARAAMAAVSVIGDDRQLDAIVDHLLDEGPVADQARLSLIGLTSRDLGLEPTVWAAALEERDARSSTIAAKARTNFTGTDPEQIRSSLHDLLTLDFSRSLAAEVIAPLLGHQDPTIATLARGTLGNIGGGVAVLLLKGGQLPEASAPTERRVKPKPAPDHTGAYALLSAFCLIGIVGFVLFRTPLKDTKPVREATRVFTRTMVRTGSLRRLQAAKRTIEETGVFKRSAKVAKKIEETGIYRALVQKPAAEAVRDATRSFRRKKP